MTEVPRYINLRFEIQHLFPSEIRTATTEEARDARGLLDSIDFDLESRGNKMALLASPEMRDALQNSPESVQQAFIDAGFGWNTQNSYHNPNAHPEYNQFIIQALADLSRDADQFNWDTSARERAVFDLLRFVDEVAPEDFPMLVTFGDLNDPTSVRLVDPENLASSFGEGVILKRITVQVTDDPVTTEIAEKLGWLPTHVGTLVQRPRNLPIGQIPVEQRLIRTDFISGVSQ